MTLDQIVSMLASIATVITAVIILFTLLEMKKQRTMSYRPSIVPVRQPIEAKTLNGDFCWSEKPNQDQEAKSSHRAYSLHLYNLGNGAAKNINIKWELDIESVIASVNRLLQKNMTQKYIEITEDNWLSIKYENDRDHMINMSLDMEGKYDHLLPASIDNRGIAVHVPYTFIILVSNYFHEGGKRFMEEDEEHTTLSNVPYIKLNITFEDIGGNKYMANYTFYVNLTMFSDSDFHALLDCKMSS